MDASSVAPNAIAGRVIPVSDQRARYDRLPAYGKIVWSWRPQAGAKPRGDVAARPGARISDRQGDGGKSASLPGESAT